ncbi:MAG: potassium-transporting ATPase subunit KdpA [Armatimonadota bacterium]
MIWIGIAQIAVFVVALLALTKPMGTYIARVFKREKTLLDPVLRPIESAVYRVCGVDPDREMKWTTYTSTMLIFSMVCVLVLYVILRLQSIHPWNAAHAPAMNPYLAFNTAVSFVTNTNWQAYSGESAATYFTQMIGLTWQNFISAGVGLALAIAFIRALSRQSVEEIGNFWVDLTRGCLWVLLPLSIMFGLVLMSQGVIQNLSPYVHATTMECSKQIIAQGPVASQEAIKILGINGGGFFNANSAHPYENPTPLTNYLQVLAIFIIPAGLTYAFGRFVGNQKQGWALFATMLILFVAGVSGIYWAEQTGNSILSHIGVNQMPSVAQSGGNMEGKEVRFGISGSALFAAATTDASCGAVNSMHDSYTPLGGGIAMLNIALGEIIFGGVGSGLLGMLVFAILAVFIAGLMVGRTPEYLGKKIEGKEMKMAMLAVLVLAASILGFSAVASVTHSGLAGRLNMGPHGLAEMLYAATSATGNNGSAFAGLSVNTPFYDTVLGLAMLVGRFLFIVPIMAIAGSLVKKKRVPESSGTFPTTGGLFVGLLVGVILIVGALTFFPAYALGPVVEHLLMEAGKLF